MSVKLRQELERRIAGVAVSQLLAAGFGISVDNGGDEDEATPVLTDAKTIKQAMFLTDNDTLFVHSLAAGLIPGNFEKTATGWIDFVYGNDGFDVMSNYTVNLEPFLTAANAIAEQYS